MAAAQTPAIKDKRWVRTRERLVRAGFDLLGQQGAEPVGIDDIASHAGISKQTFYNHFVDRDAFLIELRLESRRIFEAVVVRINAGVADPADRLARGVAVHARMAIVDPLHARFFAQFFVTARRDEPALNADLEFDLQQALERGLFAFNTTERAMNFTGAATQAMVAQLLERENDVLAVPIAQEMLSMLLRGLGLASDVAEQRAARAINTIFIMPADALIASPVARIAGTTAAQPQMA